MIAGGLVTSFRGRNIVSPVTSGIHPTSYATGAGSEADCLPDVTVCFAGTSATN